MYGKMRDGRMLSIRASPNTKRKMHARPPVTKASGNPAINRITSDPNMSRVSQPMPISRPMVYAPIRVNATTSLISLESP